jgi:hypothetical protein
VVALRSRRLETLLGSRIDDVTYARATNPVTNQVAEAFDLDVKEQLYGRADSDKRKLATYAAALANTGGGLVVIGIEEDDQARAARVTRVTLSDGEVGRMRQIVASLSAPLPVFDIVPREDPANTNTGFYLIAVPALLQLTREGKLRGTCWDRHGWRRDALEPWAEASGVGIVNDTLNG